MAPVAKGASVWKRRARGWRIPCYSLRLSERRALTFYWKYMKQNLVNLTAEDRSLLLRSKIQGNALQLPEQLARADYERIARVIKAAGGKWDRRSQSHIFPQDVRQTLNIDGDTLSVINVQQTYQSFYTPDLVADSMAEVAELFAGETLLEPSAGNGQLIEAAITSGIFAEDILAIEIDSQQHHRLDSFGCVVTIADFLTVIPEQKFDKILMNPPFSRGDDIKHILHALHFLERHGRLVALCANGPKQIEELRPRAMSWEVLPPKSFQSSGTLIDIAMAVFEN